MESLSFHQIHFWEVSYAREEEDTPDPRKE